MPNVVDSVSLSMCWALVGLTMLLLYSCVAVQQGRFRCLHRVWTGVPKVLLLLVDYVLLLVLTLLWCIAVSMSVVRLLFTMSTCEPGYTYRKCGRQLCLYTVQPLVLKSLLTSIANPGMREYVIVAITPVLLPVTLVPLHPPLMTKLATPRRNIRGTLCRPYSLTKRVFPRVVLVNRTLPPVMTLIGQLRMRVKLAIRAPLQWVPNLENLELLMRWVTTLCMLKGPWALAGMTLQRLLVGHSGLCGLVSVSGTGPW